MPSLHLYFSKKLEERIEADMKARGITSKGEWWRLAAQFMLAHKNGKPNGRSARNKNGARRAAKRRE